MIQKPTKPVFVFFSSILFFRVKAQPDLSIYNVVWDGPSMDAAGQMFTGSGDITASVHALEKDALYLLPSTNDAFSHYDDVFKSGWVKTELNPNPFTSNRLFKPILDVKKESVLIEVYFTEIRDWADSDHFGFNSTALQRLLVQEALGKIMDWSIEPEYRKKDLVV